MTTLFALATYRTVALPRRGAALLGIGSALSFVGPAGGYSGVSAWGTVLLDAALLGGGPIQWHPPRSTGTHRPWGLGCPAPSR